MALELADPVIRALAGESAKRIFGHLLSLLPSGTRATSRSIESTLSRHLKFASSWSSQYNFLGLSTPKDAKLETIPLRLTNVPRRYRGMAQRESAPEVEEDAFLQSREPVILLGDPGAGKTTTLKRICLHLMREDLSAGELEFQVPLVVILRDLGIHQSIIPYLAEALHIPLERVEDPKTKTLSFEIFGFDAIEKIAELLDSLAAVLVVDGLDELFSGQRTVIERELRLLGAYCRVSKIIASCRSGDYNRPIEGFSVYEILPLSRSEIEGIAQSWLPDPTLFLEHLDKKPYRDIVDRPLLLSFLIFLFKNEGQLPPRPSLIYRKVVYRLLRDWDEERGITRGSAYANFDTDIKIDFLSEFSYLLTYKLKSRGFSEEDVMAILGEIGESYDLPIADYTDVLREIETHTGIVVAAGFNRFEFAHLSVQEFLCANFIVRSPIPSLLKTYLAEYPAPVAVACALSSQPDQFLDQMLRRHLIEKFKNPEDFFHSLENENQLSLDLFGADTSNTLYSFLSRLELEQPVFRGSRYLGEAILLIHAFYYRRYSRRVDRTIERLSTTPTCQAALAEFLSERAWDAYGITRQTAVVFVDQIFVELYEEIAGPWPEEHPKADILPVAMIPKRLLRKAGVQISRAASSDEINDRIKRNISGTPFCSLETGRHRRRNASSICEVCGNRPIDPRPERFVPRPSSNQARLGRSKALRK